MNKNPFLPTPSYTPQQPPLPPGPPPPQPGQPDYSGWWAGAGAQQPHAQPSAPYNAQWQASQPARPSAEQSALYANYGYGNQSNWQRQQQHHQYHPPAVIQQHPPPPMQPYNPYPAAGAYPQPYVPQAAPPQPVQPAYPHHPHPPQPQMFAPSMPPHQPSSQHQPAQARQHASSQHPPAKRQRFDGPGSNRHHSQPHHASPAPPQFQPPPPPPSSGSFSGTNRPPLPSGPSGRGGAPSGPGPRGGSRGGRGGSMSSGRGGMGGGRGRGSFSAGGGGRSGGGSGQQSGQTRGHNSRNFGDKSFNNRRGGSFSSGSGYSHSTSTSFRGRNQGHSGSGRNRGDGSGLGPRDGAQSSSFGGKRDENRRTLTDFKIVGLAISELSWTWGLVPSSLHTNKGETVSDEPKEEISEESKAVDSSMIEGAQAGSKTEVTLIVPAGEVGTSEAQVSQAADANAHSPPSRIRIYFHTPVTADDSRPIPHNSSYSDGPMDSRKGKRKKLEDDDGDLDEIRAPPPPPRMAGVSEDHVSVGGSVAHSVESVSEDWLMAAIVEGEDESKTIVEAHPGEESEDGEQLQISEIINTYEHAERDGNDARIADEALPDGTSHMNDQNVMAALDTSLGGSTASAESGEARTGSAEATSLFTGSPSRASQVEGDQIAESSAVIDPSELHEQNAFSSAPDLTAVASEFVADISADRSEPPEKQVQQGSGLTSEPTLLDIETPDTSQANDSVSLSNGHQATQDFDLQLEHLPEPPASPAISSMACEDSSSLIPKGDSKAGNTPSANRLSISYARSNRRLAINAEVVETLKLFRQEGRIEVMIKVQKQEDGTLRGILTEGLSEVTKSYLPLSPPEESTEHDATVPLFSKATSANLQLLVYLDTARPLSEPKWAKTGDIQDWLKSMFGRMFWVAGEAADGWEKKIQVVDPDPPPTIWTVLEGWASNSSVGALNERQRFLKTHMTEVDNILEILLRLVRGERATPFSPAAPAASSPHISGPLLSAINPGSAHGAQQTHVSLAVLAIFRMATEYAEKAAGDKGKAAVEERVGEIVRWLPSHLIYKSLDGIFKEWRVVKKGR